MLLTTVLVLLVVALFCFILISRPLAGIPFMLALIIGKVWLVGSLIFSVYKSATDRCATTVPLDKYLSSTWLCPSEK